MSKGPKKARQRKTFKPRRKVAPARCRKHKIPDFPSPPVPDARPEDEDPMFMQL